jgi:hypothetical protein
MANTSKTKKVLLFNKETGTFFGGFDADGFNLNGIDDGIFLYKEVEMSETEFWYGDYETGKIYNSTETQIVTQMTLRDNAIKKIFSKYFYIDQIKIITDQLKGFIGEDNQTQAFKDMTTFIDEVRAEYHLQKEAYSSNPEMYIWVPDEQVEQEVNSRYEGLF